MSPQWDPLLTHLSGTRGVGNCVLNLNLDVKGTGEKGSWMRGVVTVRRFFKFDDILGRFLTRLLLPAERRCCVLNFFMNVKGTS